MKPEGVIMTKRYRTAIVGMGAIANVHIDALKRLDEADIVGICDNDPLKETIVKSLDENIRFFTDYNQMIDTLNLDVVHILTPHYLHAPMIMKAITYGIAVLTEKPAGINKEEIMEIIDYIDKNNSKVGIVLQNRFNPTVQKAKEILNEGSMGRILGMKGVLCWNRTGKYYTESNWRGRKDKEGGGFLINQAIHTLDLFYFFGGEISTVSGICSNMFNEGIIEVEDTAAVHFEFKSGASGVFLGTNAHCENTPMRFEIVCQNGSLLIEDETLYLKKDGLKTKLCMNVIKNGSHQYWGTSHFRLIDQFYKSFQNPGNPYVNYKEGLPGVEICLEIYKKTAWKEE